MHINSAISARNNRRLKVWRRARRHEPTAASWKVTVQHTYTPPDGGNETPAWRNDRCVHPRQMYRSCHRRWHLSLGAACFASVRVNVARARENVPRLSRRVWAVGAQYGRSAPNDLLTWRTVEKRVVYWHC